MRARWRGKVVPLAVFVLVAWWLIPTTTTTTSTTTTTTSKTTTATTNNDAGDHGNLTQTQAAHELCAAHGYPVFAAPRRIYDLVMVNTELDFLEIRLHALYDHVDYFIIVESPKTFQGGDKPLVIRDNWTRFRRYHDKMIYHQLVFPPSFHPRRAWDYEDLQRDAMYDQVLLRQQAPRAPALGDVMLVSDVDEIPRPQSLAVLRACRFPRRLTLASQFYYYSFQFLHTGPEWPHPQATYYDGPRRTLKPTNLRNGDGGFLLFPFSWLPVPIPIPIPWMRGRESGVLSDAGWHCSSCFATMAQFLNKMASFSHTWMNNDYFRDRDRIAAAVRQGKDLWGREHDTFTRVEGNADVPPLVLEEPNRFAYMVDRGGETAGFLDYP
ncbi:hypothetical protein E4U21_003060 [Claviceps maximensis]|nr:hypothetical protein E4U21_003060 [Claviceps maximensis]